MGTDTERMLGQRRASQGKPRQGREWRSCWEAGVSAAAVDEAETGAQRGGARRQPGAGRAPGELCLSEPRPQGGKPLNTLQLQRGTRWEAMSVLVLEGEGWRQGWSHKRAGGEDKPSESALR